VALPNTTSIAGNRAPDVERRQLLLSPEQEEAVKLRTRRPH